MCRPVMIAIFLSFDFHNSIYFLLVSEISYVLRNQIG